MLKIDMDIPLNCEDCPLRYKNLFCTAGGTINMDIDGRPNDCPLYEDTEGSPKLNMTVYEMEQEIETMRAFDKYCQDHVPMYDEITRQFAIHHAASWLEENGESGEEFIKAFEDCREGIQ